MNLLRPISTSLSPNTEKDDIFLAFKLLFQPWRWKSVSEKLTIVSFSDTPLEKEFKNYLGINYAVSFNSGRSALTAILEAFNIKEGDEVLLQAFTCNSAVNPILEKGASPIFVDVDDTLNLDPEDLKRKITPKAKAVMIQHTFGWPAQIEEISKTAEENNLFLIEDCAHSLGARYGEKFCGTFGKAAFFSFGRDKIISSVFGGMAVTNDAKTGERLKNFQGKSSYPSYLWIFQQLLHPVLMNWKILPSYGINQYLGRIVLGFFHKAGVLSKAVYKKEKKGKMSGHFPKKMPGALYVLAQNQFKKLERFNKHRREIAALYEAKLKDSDFILPLAKSFGKRQPTFMRYPVLTGKDTEEILKASREKRIFLDDGWRKSPVVPPDTKIEKMKYIPRTCPKAEKVARTILNLPTNINISRKDAQKIIDFLK